MNRFCVLVLLLLCPLLAQAADVLRVGVLPWREPDALNKLYTPTLSLLERKLGVKAELVIASDYAELGRRLSGKTVDIAVLGATSYVEAKNADPSIRYLATCVMPEDHYFSFVFVRKDSPVQTLQDVRGRSLGLTDTQSTSGYMFPRHMLRQAGIDTDRDTKVFLLRKHYRVFGAVAAGSVEVGAADMAALSDAVAAFGDIFRVIARSEPIPRDPVAAGGHVSAERAARIQRALAEADRDPEFAASSGEIRSYSVRGDRFYDPVRQVAKAVAAKSGAR